MSVMKIAFVVLTLAGLAAACTALAKPGEHPKGGPYALEKSEAEWRKQLSDLEFRILRESGTERAFTGEFHDHHADGTYVCGGCGQALFSSKTKFDSGTGWPSFFQPLKSEAIERLRDHSYGMTRTEVRCSHCGGHLGHVFRDGPAPTGLRYCINSASLDFKDRAPQTRTAPAKVQTAAKDAASAAD
ncbi:MAG: peptide-methionine (R)-S-oxide reductase MsrB [Myxococcota bacterium]